MFKINYKLWMLMSAVMFYTVACNKLKDFGNTNVDPNGVSVPSYAALLTNVEANIPGTYWGGGGVGANGGYYTQYYSETQYPAASLYAIPQSNFQGEYSGVIYDCQNIIKNSPSANQVAVATVLKNYLLWTVTDRWGDVPYSEALTGINGTPVLDKQEDIYKGLISSLTDAVGSFNTSSIITGDISNYAGNAASWKRLANSLRVLMALRLSKRYPGASDYAATELKAALSADGGVITDNSQNYQITFPGGSFRSPWFNTYDGRKDFAESNTVAGIMSSLGDGRQSAFGGKSETHDQSNPDWNKTSNIGVPYGVKRETVTAFTDANPGWARVLRGDLRDQASSVPVLTAAQVYLARAEAADRGWTSESATDMYKSGINASFAQWGVALPNDTYFAQSSVALGASGTGANIQQIAIQQWIASYPDGIQGWSNWRRTGYPVLTPAADATNSSKLIPRRYVYGTSEYGSNGINVKDAAARMTGGDTQDSRIWWDQ